jgi:hypothetical protein
MIRRARGFVSFVHRGGARLRRRAAALRPFSAAATQKRTSAIRVSHVPFQRAVLVRRWKRFAAKTALAGARASELDCVLRGRSLLFATVYLGFADFAEADAAVQTYPVRDRRASRASRATTS